MAADTTKAFLICLKPREVIILYIIPKTKAPIIPNIEKQDKDFEEWFAEICPTDTDKIQYRKINYLPEMQYSYDKFLQFVSDRRKKIKNQLKVELM